MDFLDPKRRRSHRRRLLIGYLLMAVALAMATWLVLFSANGFWFDRNTGDIIQNGTVFVDSQPVSSSVYLNGVLQGSKTATRLVLPGSKQYTIKLTASGYRDWNRTFTLEGGHIERLVYPLLIPKTLTPKETQLLAAAPLFSSQSPDKHWLVMQQSDQTNSFDVYDLSGSSPAPSTIALSQNIMTDPTKPATYKAIEWASDNHHVLVQRDYSGGSEFLLIDTSSVASSVNINKQLTVTPSTVTLREKKADQVYLFDNAEGVLKQGDLKNRTVSAAVISNALSYKTYGSELVVYVTKTGAEIGKANVRVRENDKASYLLKTVSESSNYFLDVAEYDGTPYYVIGGSSDDAVFIYRDPLPALKGQQNKALLIPSVIRLADPRFVSFSPNNQFLMVQSGKKMIVYDVDGDRQYKLVLDHNVAVTDKLKWVDGFHLSFVDQERAYVIDFDGSNEEQLVPSLGSGAFYSPDSKNLFVVAPSKTVVGRFSLTQTSLVKK